MMMYIKHIAFTVVVMVLLTLFSRPVFGQTDSSSTLPGMKHHQLLLSVDVHSVGFLFDNNISLYAPTRLSYGYKFYFNNNMDGLFFIPKGEVRMSSFNDIGGGIEFVVGKDILDHHLALIASLGSTLSYTWKPRYNTPLSLSIEGCIGFELAYSALALRLAGGAAIWGILGNTPVFYNGFVTAGIGLYL